MKTRHELYGHPEPEVTCPACISNVLAIDAGMDRPFDPATDPLRDQWDAWATLEPNLPPWTSTETDADGNCIEEH